MNTSSGSADLRDIANVYETLGKFLSDLNLLSDVRCIAALFNVALCYYNYSTGWSNKNGTPVLFLR